MQEKEKGNPFDMSTWKDLLVPHGNVPLPLSLYNVMRFRAFTMSNFFLFHMTVSSPIMHSELGSSSFAYINDSESQRVEDFPWISSIAFFIVIVVLSTSLITHYGLRRFTVCVPLVNANKSIIYNRRRDLSFSVYKGFVCKNDEKI